MVSERCVAAGVEGLRADLTVCKAACAWAAYQGRSQVEIADVDAVADLALAHRRTPPSDPEPNGPKSHPFRRNGAGNQMASGGRKLPEESTSDSKISQGADPTRSPGEMVFPSAGLFVAQSRPDPRLLAESTLPGRWRRGTASRSGPRHVAPRSTAGESSIAWADSLRAAAPHQLARGRTADDSLIRLHAEDLRKRPPRGPAGCLLLFLIDASGSMSAWRACGRPRPPCWRCSSKPTSGATGLACLLFAIMASRRCCRQRAGFPRPEKPWKICQLAGRRRWRGGLAAVRRLVGHQRRLRPDQPIWTVLLSDGRTNIPLASADPWQDALVQARLLATCDTECLVVDTETGWPRFARAGGLARALGAICLSVEAVLGRPVSGHAAVS